MQHAWCAILGFKIKLLLPQLRILITQAGWYRPRSSTAFFSESSRYRYNRLGQIGFHLELGTFMLKTPD